jgi:hypothetical protein
MHMHDRGSHSPACVALLDPRRAAPRPAAGVLAAARAGTFRDACAPAPTEDAFGRTDGEQQVAAGEAGEMGQTGGEQLSVRRAALLAEVAMAAADAVDSGSAHRALSAAAARAQTAAFGLRGPAAPPPHAATAAETAATVAVAGVEEVEVGVAADEAIILEGGALAPSTGAHAARKEEVCAPRARVAAPTDAVAVGMAETLQTVARATGVDAGGAAAPPLHEGWLSAAVDAGRAGGSGALPAAVAHSYALAAEEARAAAEALVASADATALARATQTHAARVAAAAAALPAAPAPDSIPPFLAALHVTAAAAAAAGGGLHYAGVPVGQAAHAAEAARGAAARVEALSSIATSAAARAPHAAADDGVQPRTPPLSLFVTPGGGPSLPRSIVARSLSLQVRRPVSLPASCTRALLAARTHEYRISTLNSRFITSPHPSRPRLSSHTLASVPRRATT